jgi:acyl-coenzyme A thioesterase PaaI-like protein
LPEVGETPLGLGLRYSLEERAGQQVLVGLFSPGPQHRGAPGFLHGGMAAAALDETMAGVSYALDRVRTVTGTLNLRYRRPVPLSAAPLRVEAWRERHHARRAHRIRGRIVLPDGTVAVEATGIFVQATLG